MRLRRIAVFVASVLAAALVITGCSGQASGAGKNNKEQSKAGRSDSDLKEVEFVRKQRAAEGNIEEDKSIYSDDADTSVVTMYLTVSQGNKADGSDHTWEEINSYSAYDYEKMGVDRYKVEGVLQIDDTGNGITKDSFGYGQNVPNVSVQVRGQTSSRSNPKNYKIRIKDGKDRFRGQRTLNLNKHKSDPYRFLNKMCYDLLEDVPQLIGGRTQFVHLYVKDDSGSTGELEGIAEDRKTPDENGYVDYGLYTMVEQVNRTYLKAHGLDENGHLYKVNFFEWNENEEVMTPWTDPEYDRDDFENLLEIKGNEDPTKLQEVIKEIHNYTIPIDHIIDEHFDEENLCYWMAFNILTGNYDSGARNLFIYSPLNSKKFYMICWDMDSSFKTSYNKWLGYHDGEPWENGMTKYLGVTLVNRMMKEEKYRDMLTVAVDDLYNHQLTANKIEEKVNQYKTVTERYLYNGGADVDNAQIEEEPVYDELTGKIGSEVDDNYGIYEESLRRPWPFYVEVPVVYKEQNKLTLSWGIAYDPSGSDVTYDYILARDYMFEDVIDSGADLTVPLATTDILPAGTYFLNVTAKNDKGVLTNGFDYYTVKGYGKVYGCYCFIVKDNGTIKAYEASE